MHNEKTTIWQGKKFLISSAICLFLTIAIVWMLYLSLGHKVVEAMYEGRSVGFLNRIIEEQSKYPIGFYLRQADELFIRFFIVLILLLGPAYLVLCMNNRYRNLNIFRNRIKRYIAGYPMPVCLVLIALLTLMELRLVMLIHHERFKILVDAAHGVIIGTPHWVAYQNRLLGPWLVQFISQLTGWAFTKSFIIFIVMSLLLANLVSFYLFFDLTKNRLISLKYTLYFSLCFLALQDISWLFLWDFLDIMIFFVFVYGIFRNWKTRFFIYLFIVSLLNRENALFISLWLIIDAFKYESKSPNIRTRSLKINYPNLLLGILLSIVGILYIKLVRDWLFVRSGLSGVGLDSVHAAIGQHIVLFANIARLFNVWHQKNINILPAFLFIGLTIYLFIKMRFDQFFIKVMLLFLCMLVSIFVFGYISEPRVFFMLIPFILVLNLELSDKIRPVHKL